MAKNHTKPPPARRRQNKPVLDPTAQFEGKSLADRIRTPYNCTLAKEMSICGFSQDDIAALIKNPNTGKGVGLDTLRKYFPEELAQGQATMVKELVGAFRKNVRRGKEASIIFGLKTRARWSEKHEHVLMNPDGSPVQALPPSLNVTFSGSNLKIEGKTSEKSDDGTPTEP